MLALVMCVATVLVAQSQNLPIRDPDDAFGPSWIRLPLILLAAVLIDVVPRVVLRWRRGTRGVPAIRHVLAERWPHEQIRFTLIGLASWYLTYSAFRNLKSAVPFVNDRLWDAQLADLDHMIWLGHDPAPVLHDLLGVGWAATFLTGVYLLWIGLIPASLAWALTWTRNHARRRVVRHGARLRLGARRHGLLPAAHARPDLLAAGRLPLAARSRARPCSRA